MFPRYSEKMFIIILWEATYSEKWLTDFNSLTSNVPEEVTENITNQIPPLGSILKTPGYYSKEEIEKCSKIINYPEDFILSKNKKLCNVYNFI